MGCIGMRTLNRAARVGLTLLLGCGCSRTGNEAFVYLRDRPSAVLALDSPTVRQLVNAESARQRAVLAENRTREDPDLAERAKFVEALENSPSLRLAPGTNLTVLERSTCRCQLDVHSSAVVLLVEVTSGPKRASIGWICQGAVGFRHPSF